MKKQYLSPSVRFENLLLLEKIANPCWAYTSQHKGVTMYFRYDDPNIPNDECDITVIGDSCGNVDIGGIDPTIATYLKGKSGQPSQIASYKGAAS